LDAGENSKMEMYWATNLKPPEQEARTKTSLESNLRINVSKSNPISISNSNTVKLISCEKEKD
jgi:hypothetical protein